MYNVESGVEVPKVRRKHLFPYAQMNVGDSFFVEGMPIGAMCNYNKRNGLKLQMKFIAKRDGEGVRIWRVE